MGGACLKTLGLAKINVVTMMEGLEEARGELDNSVRNSSVQESR